MQLFRRFFEQFGKQPPPLPVSSPPVTNALPAQPAVSDQPIPGTLSLGWYYNAERDQLQMVKIPLEDRDTHLYTMGASGVGKTKFIEFPIKQDIQMGNGFCIISPHEDLVVDTLGFLASYYHDTKDESIFDQVVIVDPTDPKYTVSFNVLEVPPGVAPIEQVQELIAVFKRIWANSWGVRMEELMRNALLALSQTNLTLAHLSEFLTSQPFRTQVLEKVDHPIVKPYFERFDAMSRAAQLQWTEPVTNKVNAFLSDERIRQMLGQSKSTFNLRDIMDKRKKLLIKLNKSKLQSSADLLGSLFMAKLQMAAFSRADIPEGERVPFYLYIDEFQNFATESFAVVLSEARKYGLALILAHQTLEQIPTDLRSIILGNAGIQVYFRMNRRDAELLAKEAFTYSGYTVKTVQWRRNQLDTRYWSLGEEWERNFAMLQNLPPRCCFIKHKIQGGMLPVETADIEPAWKVLGMTQEEYTAYLAHLPFGKQYLIDRSSLTTKQEAPPQPEKPLTPQEQEEDPRANAPTSQQAIPHLDIQHRAFLEFIIANPDTPSTTVYKGLQVGVWKGEKLSESLKAQGFIEEIETRLGRAGRRTIFFLPTFKTLELFGKELPAGRGGTIHRYLQQVVQERATNKGYTAQCEKDLGNGGIVDVHLEKDGVKIAVEISVASKPQREVEHFKNCLAIGYDRVVGVFLDEGMRARVQELIAREFSEGEVARIQLVPLSKLSGFV